MEDLNRLMICENDPEFNRDHPGRLVDEGLDSVMGSGYGMRPCVVFLQDFLRANVKEGYDSTQPLPVMPFLLINTPPDGNCLFYGIRNAALPHHLLEGPELNHRTGLPYSRKEFWLEQQRIIDFRYASVTLRQVYTHPMEPLTPPKMPGSFPFAVLR
jgi:hypothetical protein